MAATGSPGGGEPTEEPGADRPDRPADDGTERPVSLEPDRYEVALVLVERHGSGERIVTSSVAELALRELRDAYLEYSYGRADMIGRAGGAPDLYGPYTIDLPLAEELEDCPVDTARGLIDQAVAASMVDLSTYDFVVYAVAWGHCIETAGASYGPYVFVRAEVDQVNGWTSFDSSTLVHEIGHSLGLPHANALRCTDHGMPAPIGDDCSSETYQDPSDVMGQGGHFNGLFKAQLGWLSPAQIVTVTESGDRSITALEAGSQDPMVLRVRRSASEVFSVEYRVPTPSEVQGTGDPVPGGVYVRLRETGNDYAPTNVIDMHPRADEEVWEFGQDAALSIGQTFRDPVSGISITNVGEDGDQARVRVELP